MPALAGLAQAASVLLCTPLAGAGQAGPRPGPGPARGPWPGHRQFDLIFDSDKPPPGRTGAWPMALTEAGSVLLITFSAASSRSPRRRGGSLSWPACARAASSLPRCHRRHPPAAAGGASWQQLVPVLWQGQAPGARPRPASLSLRLRRSTGHWPCSFPSLLRIVGLQVTSSQEPGCQCLRPCKRPGR